MPPLPRSRRSRCTTAEGEFPNSDRYILLRLISRMMSRTYPVSRSVSFSALLSTRSKVTFSLRFAFAGLGIGFTQQIKVV